MENLLRMFQQQQAGGGGGNAPAGDDNKPDTAETVIISSLALLKMLKHGRAVRLGLRRAVANAGCRACRSR